MMGYLEDKSGEFTSQTGRSQRHSLASKPRRLFTIVRRRPTQCNHYCATFANSVPSLFERRFGRGRVWYNEGYTATFTPESATDTPTPTPSSIDIPTPTSTPSQSPSPTVTEIPAAGGLEGGHPCAARLPWQARRQFWAAAIAGSL